MKPSFLYEQLAPPARIAPQNHAHAVKYNR